jgi:Fe-S cluster assembly scaffold protein SufB
LRARGVDEAAARQMLIEAFLGEVVEQIAVDGVRDELNALLHRRLTGKEAV